VTDNGRGIPVELHPQTKKYVAETVFSNLRAGSNFNDTEDQQLIGTNGVGSTLTNILSTHFRVESCDGKKVLTQDFYKGMRERTEPKIRPDTKNRTRISFTPDYEFFKLKGLDGDHALKMTKKVVDAAACNPKVKFYVNGDRINVKDFSDYIALYDPECVVDDTESWKVGISHSDGFEQISFVNSVETFQGGTHVFYVMDQITESIREYIKKKHKVEVKPAEIRNHMRVYISANINRPKFSSQTKENMISQPSSYQTNWVVPDSMIKKLLKSPIIQAVLDWVEMKAKAAEMAELRKLNKDASKMNPKRVDKFDDAVEKRDRHLCECYFTEGDSARNSIQSARGKNPYIGSFSLRGKPLNVYDCEIKDVIANNEFANMLAITGLQLGEKVLSKTQLRFGKLVVLSDQDLDGFHITSLLLSFWAKYWPELFELGVVYRMNTPLYIATTTKGEVHEFFTQEEYDTWLPKAPKHKAEYYKGLGLFDTEVFERFLENREKYLVRVTTLGGQGPGEVRARVLEHRARCPQRMASGHPVLRSRGMITHPVAVTFSPSNQAQVVYHLRGPDQVEIIRADVTELVQVYPKLSTDEYTYQIMHNTGRREGDKPGAHIVLAKKSGETKRFWQAGHAVPLSLINHMNSLTDDLCAQWFNVREKKGKNVKSEK
jgi:DNA gyrase/topoisomerase IV subunit B